MTTNNWLRLDDFRESWLFLLLGASPSSADAKKPSKTEQIEFWEMGVGNSDRLVKTMAGAVGVAGVDSETDLIRSLIEQSRPYRYQNTVLVTPDQETVRLLRRSLAPNAGSLRGFTHLDVESLLGSYFGQGLEDYKLSPQSWTEPRQSEGDTNQAISTGTVERLWEAWVRIFPLLPPSELTGEPL